MLIKIVSGFSVFLGFLVKLLRDLGEYNSIVSLGYLPSFFYTLGMCLIWVIYCEKAEKNHYFSMPIFIGSAGYEVSQLWLEGTFSLADMIALTVGFIVALSVLKLNYIVKINRIKKID